MIRIEQSQNPAANLYFDKTAKHSTELLWLLNIFIEFSFSISQNRIVSSSEPLTSVPLNHLN
jgi:hypothetical protein